jgi:hypothetical protein
MTNLLDMIDGALGDVPVLLLDGDDAAVLEDARASIGVLRQITDQPAVVVFVGPSGSGRSFVFNLTVGAGLSSEGVLRPTTTTIVTAAGHQATGTDLPGESAAEPGTRATTVFVDTPSWEHDPESVREEIAKADLLVLVVSPGRYGDASVGELWHEMGNASVAVVLNRAPDDPSARADVVNAMRSVFGVDPIVIREGAEDSTELRTLLTGRLEARPQVAGRAIMVRSATAAMRFIAGAVTNNAWQIEAVLSAVRAAPTPRAGREPMAVLDDWETTRQGMVKSIARRIRSRESEVVSESRAPLAQRIRDRLGPWDEETLEADLDAWRARCVTLHEAAASLRWRRKSGMQLIERLSWKSAINDDVVHSKRFLRMMGKGFPAIVAATREELTILLEGSVEERRIRWLDALNDLGAYQPGVLVTLAESLESEQRFDG